MSHGKVFTFSLMFLAGLVLMLVPQNASADVLMPGQKGVDYCFEISNIYEFPDYIFIATLNFMSAPAYRGEYDTGEYNVINPGDCVSFYKFRRPRIFAIRTDEFNQEDLIFENDSRLIPSEIEIVPVITVVDTDPTESVKDVLEIISLSNGKLEIKKSKVVYTYTDGTNEEKSYVNQDERPSASRKPIIPVSSYDMWFFIIPVAAIILIVVILISRRFRR